MKKKSLRVLSLLLIFVLLLTGCGAKKESMAYDSAAAEAPMEDVWLDETVEEEAAAEGAAPTESGVQEVKDVNRKLIKRYYLDLETREYDDLIVYIEDAVEKTGGYIESSNMSGTSLDEYGSRYAYFVLRIPTAGASSFLDGIEKEAHVTYKSEEVEDVTLAYVDTESRIESLRVEQEALMEMLEQADELETIFSIQSRLTEVRYQLESYESQIRSYDNLVDYTTITVDVREVVRETPTSESTFGDRLKDSFADGFEDFGRGIQNLVIWFAGAIPAFLVLAVLAVVVVLVIKKIKRRTKDIKEKEALLKTADKTKDSEEKDK